MSVVCLLSSHANCSVCLCLFACCVLWALLPEIKWMMMMMMMIKQVKARLACRLVRAILASLLSILCYLLCRVYVSYAENARPENDGQRKLWVWKMQEYKSS